MQISVFNTSIYFQFFLVNQPGKQSFAFLSDLECLIQQPKRIPYRLGGKDTLDLFLSFNYATYSAPSNTTLYLFSVLSLVCNWIVRRSEASNIMLRHGGKTYDLLFSFFCGMISASRLRNLLCVSSVFIGKKFKTY